MLSIIIVNYRVKYFTEQCLYSVQRAIEGMHAEVMVVDNNSADESVAYLQEKFPWVSFIENKENVGYARANNQGWQCARGEVILFLNPDTIVTEDALAAAVQALQLDKDMGALGIQMIDGTGRFLPESKRGFPSPMASFYKLSGLVKLFPTARRIAQYYMGWLRADQNNEVDVLSGAFMMVKRQVLEKTGGFDEQFFMYGEDIDLSYRIRQAGYKNYYLGAHAILHFKGESTRKDARYTLQFYKAMVVFVQKHYGKTSWGFSLLLQMAIALRGVLSFGRQRLAGNKHARSANKIIRTILVGAAAEQETAMQILRYYNEVKRDITGVPALAVLTDMDAGNIYDIVFCTGVLQYKQIIEYMKTMAGKAGFLFFAGDCIVGSASRKSSGEVMVLPERKAIK